MTNAAVKTGAKKMPEQQRRFIVLFMQLMISTDVVNTSTDASEIAEAKRIIDRAKTALWENILYYVRGMISTSMASYRKANDYYADLEQDCAMIFFSQLEKYDPKLATPTTFFTPYFKQVISNYRHADSQRLSANDAKNIGKIKSAIAEHIKKNEDYDCALLATETGLSEKVVTRSLKRMENSAYADIDTAFDIASKEPGPEAETLRLERDRALYDAINSLDDFEREVFLYKANHEHTGGYRERSYKDVAEYFGITLQDARKIINTAKLKLSRYPALASLYNQTEDELEATAQMLNLHTDASDLMLNDIVDCITDETTDDN